MTAPRVITNTTPDLMALLQEAKPEMVVHSEPKELIEIANTQACHVVFIDYQALPAEMQEPHCLTQYLRQIHLANGMKTVLANYSKEEMLRRLLEAHLIVDCVQPHELRTLRVTQTVKTAYEKFLGERDALTKLYNRSYLEHKLNEAVEETKESLNPLAIAFFDLDNFKGINDTYHHKSGDAALRAFGVVLKDSCQHRERDTPGRYGGDEFMVIAQRTDRGGMEKILGRIYERVHLARISHPQAPEGEITFTVSGGVAFYDGLEKEMNPDQLKAQADTQLYSAKESGRNRVCGMEAYVHSQRK